MSHLHKTQNRQRDPHLFSLLENEDYRSHFSKYLWTHSFTTAKLPSPIIFPILYLVVSSTGGTKKSVKSQFCCTKDCKLFSVLFTSEMGKIHWEWHSFFFVQGRVLPAVPFGWPFCPFTNPLPFMYLAFACNWSRLAQQLSLAENFVLFSSLIFSFFGNVVYTVQMHDTDKKYSVIQKHWPVAWLFLLFWEPLEKQDTLGCAHSLSLFFFLFSDCLAHLQRKKKESWDWIPKLLIIPVHVSEWEFTKMGGKWKTRVSGHISTRHALLKLIQFIIDFPNMGNGIAAPLSRLPLCRQNA